MNLFRNFLCASLLIASVAMSAEPVGVQIHDRSDFRGDLVLKAGSQELGKITLTGSDKDVGFGKFVWPDGAKSASVSGDLRFTDDDRGPQIARGSHEWQVVDIAPLTKPLRDNSLPIAGQLKQMIAAQKVFEAKRVALLDGISRIVDHPDERTPHAEIVAAEKRLGFTLPVEHVRLLEDFGAFHVDDSKMLPAPSLRNAFDQMEQEWETSRDELDELPAKTKKLLRSSVMLFSEAGDGYGGWLYQPPTEPNGRPTFYWIHQETINRPRRLLNQDGSVKSYSQALLWLLTQQVIARYDQGVDEYLFVDRTSPATLKYRLVPDSKPTLRANLMLDWESFE